MFTITYKSALAWNQLKGLRGSRKWTVTSWFRFVPLKVDGLRSTEFWLKTVHFHSSWRFVTPSYHKNWLDKNLSKNILLGITSSLFWKAKRNKNHFKLKSVIYFFILKFVVFLFFINQPYENCYLNLWKIQKTIFIDSFLVFEIKCFYSLYNLWEFDILGDPTILIKPMKYKIEN